MAADHHLLFGLIAFQNGLIEQARLVAAFHAWTCDTARPLAEHLLERGDLGGSSHRRVIISRIRY